MNIVGIRAVARAVAVALFAGASAHAQPRPRSTSVSVAAAEFRQGVARLDQHRYNDAAAAFERSLALRQSASALYNLGLACRGAGATLRAVAAFERFLAVARPTSPARRSAVAMLAELRHTLAHVSLAVQGDGAEVRVDDEPVSLTDRAIELTLAPGPHAFEARCPGYRPARVERTLAPSEVTRVSIDGAADPLPARVVIDVDDPAAAVRIDGASRGVGRIEAMLPPGAHRIDVTLASGAERHRDATLRPGADERWAVPREPAPVAPRPSLLRSGWLWAGIGAGVLLVAGAILAGVLLDGGDGGPQGGSWNAVIQTVRVWP